MTEHQEECDFLEDNNNIKSDSTYECKVVDDVMKVQKINEALIPIGEPSIKLRSTVSLSLAEKKELNKFVKKVKNLNLKVRGMKEAMQRKNSSYECSYRDFINEIVCENPSSRIICFLLNCEQCPGIVPFSKKLKNFLKSNNIKKVKFIQWITTYR